MPQDDGDLVPRRLTRLTIRNDAADRLLVSLDPWGAYEHVEPCGSLRLACRVPSGGWTQLDLAAGIVFLNAWRGSECTLELTDATGASRTGRLPVTQGRVPKESTPQP